LGIYPHSLMSSLFQGLVDAQGRVRTTTAAPTGSSVIFRGIALNAAGAVHISGTEAVAMYVCGVPVSNKGVVCIKNSGSSAEGTIPGGCRLSDGRLYTTSSIPPEYIHQGVGVLSSGRLCRISV